MRSDSGYPLAAFATCRVLVVGDLMLDEFIRGDVARISPEAPVPILDMRDRSSTPGGAANAANNVRSLGASAAVVGVVGDDAPGAALRALLESAAIDTTGIVGDASRPTTQKTRVVARGQQVVRIDHESRAALDATIREALIQRACAAVANADACIVSDYGKGVVTPELVTAIVDAARPRKTPIVVDPKRRDFDAYRGATVVTPNLLELEHATGRHAEKTDDVVASGSSLLGALGGGALLVTRGASGMTLLEAGKPPVHTPARARAVFDVTGAGDTVVSTLALALATGVPLASAIELASVAAGLVVSKVGTATVTVDELRDAMGGSAK
jgi:D-beta-D-heptose 7-phosphate kinase/D-beta-D-heptose 1-phosphate adenosyltransferase